MAGTEIVVVDKPLDETWSAFAEQILAMGKGKNTFDYVRVASGHGRGLFAFVEEAGDPDDAIGVLTYVAIEPNRYHRTLRIAMLSVMPSQRRLGVAKALVERAYRIAVDEKCTEVDALVNSYNAQMMRLLKKAGFGREVVRLSKVVEEKLPDDDLDSLI